MNSGVYSGNGEIDRVYIDPNSKELKIGSGNHTENLENLDTVNLTALCEALSDELNLF